MVFHEVENGFAQFPMGFLQVYASVFLPKDARFLGFQTQKEAMIFLGAPRDLFVVAEQRRERADVIAGSMKLVRHARARSGFPFVDDLFVELDQSINCRVAIGIFADEIAGRLLAGDRVFPKLARYFLRSEGELGKLDGEIEIAPCGDVFASDAEAEFVMIGEIHCASHSEGFQCRATRPKNQVIFLIDSIRIGDGACGPASFIMEIDGMFAADFLEGF